MFFPWLDTSCGWFHPVTDWKSRRWIWLTTNSILRVTRSCGWSYPLADWTFDSWIWLAADLCLKILSKFKDLFCKIHHYHGYFSSSWFQLPLVQALTAVPKTLKKLEETWRSFKDLAETDSSCSEWFKL